MELNERTTVLPSNLSPKPTEEIYTKLLNTICIDLRAVCLMHQIDARNLAASLIYQAVYYKNPVLQEFLELLEGFNLNMLFNFLDSKKLSLIVQEVMFAESNIFLFRDDGLDKKMKEKISFLFRVKVLGHEDGRPIMSKQELVKAISEHYAEYADNEDIVFLLQLFDIWVKAATDYEQNIYSNFIDGVAPDITNNIKVSETSRNGRSEKFDFIKDTVLPVLKTEIIASLCVFEEMGITSNLRFVLPLTNKHVSRTVNTMVLQWSKNPAISEPEYEKCMKLFTILYNLLKQLSLDSEKAELFVKYILTNKLLYLDANALFTLGDFGEEYNYDWALSMIDYHTLANKNSVPKTNWSLLDKAVENWHENSIIE